MLRILADQAIPNAKEIFSAFGDVQLKYGRDITADDLVDIDALIVRSVTKVNDELLSKANCLKFVGTATAGTDHIDRNALDRKKVLFSAAVGCNARSVADYILSVLMVLAQRYSLDFTKMSIGIVGMGHVGSRVYRRAQALGLKTVCCDPPRAYELHSVLESMQGKGDPRFQGADERAAAVHILSEGDEFMRNQEFANPSLYEHSLEEALQCDIVTIHTPLSFASPDNKYPTYHLISYDELSKMREGQILINTSRGPVVDNQALYEMLSQNSGYIHAWLDVFEEEPDILVKDLIPYLEGCTAHIAGYALEAKNRGTEIIAHALNEQLHLNVNFTIPKSSGDFKRIELGDDTIINNDFLSRLVFSMYDVRRDDSLFRTQCFDGPSFDALRKHYQERHELNSVRIKCANSEQVRSLYHLGFKISAS